MPIATIAGRYDLEERIDGGGMGDVWRGSDKVLDRPVAVKLVSDRHLRAAPEAASILRDEARTAGRLIGNAQIVSILDLVENKSSFHKGPALVMEYVSGCDLGDWISQWHGKVHDTATRHLLNVYLALNVVEAIDVAHRSEVIHRDIKPDNVLISQTGQVKVADFGLARFIEAITRTHTVWGHRTAMYAAPEQWRDEKPDVKTDVYQLCSTLYHLLVGTPASDASTLFELMRWHLNGSVPDVAAAAPFVEKPIAEAINGGLVKSPSDRIELWKLVDAFSTALMKPLRLAIDGSKMTDENRTLLAKLTDMEFESDLTTRATFPNPLEAAREAIATIFLGGQPTLQVAANTAKEGTIPAAANSTGPSDG